MANEQLQSTIESLHERRRKRERMTRIGWIVAGVCALILLACLMVPAFTMEHNKYDCGLEEHTHTDKCYTNEVVCGFPTENAHVHTPSCYNKNNVLTCKKAEAGHIHLAACYDKNGKLTCDKEETVHIHKASCFDKNGNNVCKNKDALHVHGDTCYTEVKAEDKSSAKDSDDEKSSKAATTAVTYKLSCNEKSYGHVHNSSCYNENGKLVCGEDEKVEIPHKHDESCYEKVLACGQEEHTHTDECLKEEAPIEVEDDGIDQVEADGTDNGVAEGDAAADVDTAEADTDSTEGEPSDAAEPDLTEQEIADAEDQGLFYENKDMMVAFTVPDDIKDSVKLTVTETNEEVVPYTEQDLSEFAETSVEAGKAESEADGSESAEGTDEGADDAVSDGDQGTDAQADNAAAPQAQSAESGDQPEYQINLHVEATLNGQPVEDIASLGITAKLQMKSKVISPILKDINYKEVAAEIKDEVGAEITVIQQPEAPASAMLSEIPDAKVDEVIVTNVKDAATTFSLVADTFTAKASNTPNPTFKVEYKAPIETPELSDNGVLPVIDTTGGNLPKNGVTPATKKLALNSNGTVKMKTEETAIYESKTFKYHAAPNLKFFNTVKSDADNTSYDLWKVRVTTDGKTTEYVVSKKAKYKNEYVDLHFTNREQSAGVHDGRTYALIKDNTTIVLIFEATTSDEDFSATFYDYDISNGWIYRARPPENKATDYYQHKTAGETFVGDSLTSGILTWASGLSNWDKNLYTYTQEQGINSSGNYSGSGTKLAFGNVNTGTGLGKLTWSNNGKNNELNKYNNSSYQGCTFGLVTGLSGGNIQYAPGVQAPKLFNEGDTTGKTSYNYDLQFARNGDTYTISKVNGTGATGLQSFNNPSNSSGTHSNIWTNNFWPMDSASSFGTGTHDVKFGGTATYKGGTHEIRFGPITQRGTDYTFPESDDGKYHNSYFGMHYSVKFNLDKDYIGPLEYLFFGDDDLWIFLDNKLVVDIGGVHSSVGEYVNLWDYIKKGDEGEHTLSIFYTERGASGSTCYMNFTLPSVTNDALAQETGEIKIMKEVSAPSGSTALDKDEFEFTINLEDGDQTALMDDYSYTRYDKNGNVVESNLIVWDGGKFTLKNGDYIIIQHLPIGTKYTIQEVLKPEEPYRASWNYYVNGVCQDQAEGSVPGEAPSFTGYVDSNTTSYKLIYTNTVPYELPDTGGIGVHWFWIAGGALVIISVGALVWRRRRSAVSA